MFIKFISFVFVLISLAAVSGCQRNAPQGNNIAPSSLREVLAVRLNYRYEADVPGPEPSKAASQERNAAVQADFDQNRPQELLDGTIVSPDKKRLLAIYHTATDLQSEYRLDMYTADGKLLRKVTPDAMAVHFPDTIVWSPDSSAVAFVAMVRAVRPNGTGSSAAGTSDNTNTNSTIPANSNTDSSVNANLDANTLPPEDSNTDTGNAVPPAPTPPAPTGILTFRTEQIYICNSDGGGIKGITEKEGLIYFYYVWSPDSTMLAALAATAREWQYLQYQADLKGELFVPQGRPRLVEKNGRERRLDDALTTVKPVWSPDSAKVAEAFDTQIRIYDAAGNNPTQAAIPLRNHLLLSSQVFDREQQLKLQASNANANAPANTASGSNQPLTTLPDPGTLVSFNPIVDLEWTAEDILYFRTAFVKRMKNEADSVTSFARWHRLILSPQAVTITN